MAVSIDQIKDKIAKMMAKEESCREMGNQAEAEAFAGKVQELLLAYELSMDDIRRNEPDSVIVIKEQFETGTLTNRHESNWVVHLYHACSKPNFCTILTIGGPAATNIWVVGTKMNIEFLHFMAMQLIPRIRDFARKSFADHKGIVSEKRNTYIRGFLRGCAQGIHTKLALQRRLEASNSTQVAGLVVQKQRAVDNFMEKTFGKLRKSAQKPTKGNAGYYNGLVTGKDMDVAIKKDRGWGGTKLLE